jgi:chloramphenicol 3-O-phosphotransferase
VVRVGVQVNVQVEPRASCAMSERPRIVVITGPPDAGKTSVAEAFAAATERRMLVDGDAFYGLFVEATSPHGSLKPTDRTAP